MIYDFHTHTTLSDGALSPLELVHRATLNKYAAIALTDHVGLGYLSRLVGELARDCALARESWDIIAIPGVELTHLPPSIIDQAAREAKELGAWLVVVHGESIAEPVRRGTNLAAVASPFVDILAHPGLLTAEEAALAAANGVFIELTTRKGHCLTNGQVASAALKAGAKLLINSDAHNENELLTSALVRNAALGCGIKGKQLQEILTANPHSLLKKLPLSSPARF